MIDVKFTGLNAMNSKMAKILAESEVATGEGLRKTLRKIATESLKQCPLEDGDLRDSMKVTVNDKVILKGNNNGTPDRGGNITRAEKYDAEITYDTPYAVKQHEDTSLKHRNGTKAKYLEDPLNQYGGDLLEDIRMEMLVVMK